MKDALILLPRALFQLLRVHNRQNQSICAPTRHDSSDAARCSQCHSTVPSICGPKDPCGQEVYHTYGIAFAPLHLIAIVYV